MTRKSMEKGGTYAGGVRIGKQRFVGGRGHRNHHPQFDNTEAQELADYSSGPADGISLDSESSDKAMNTLVQSLSAVQSSISDMLLIQIKARV